MAMKKHHKIIIGSFSSLLIILLITNSVVIYILYGKLQYDYSQLTKNLQEIEKDTQSKLNELTKGILQTKGDIKIMNTELGSMNTEISSMDKEFALLKASVGEDFSGIIEDAIKSVVTIRTDVGQGTGFIINKEGYVVTNAHVLSGGRTINVIDYKQNSILAKFIGYDLNIDIALLKIPKKDYRLELTNSDDVHIGEKVIAIGNPLGLQFSVSQGIVSAVHRPGPNGIEAYIQTDAALNPGNSGGPLINKEGKVIGINNFKIGGGESLGFALESNYIESAINNISAKALNRTLV